MTVTNNIYQKQIKYHVFNAVTNSELTELVPVFTIRPAFPTSVKKVNTSFKNVWRTCGPALPTLLADLMIFCPLGPTNFKNSVKGDHPRTIPAKFVLIWFSDFRGEDLNVIFYQNMSNMHNRYKSAERKISQKSPEYIYVKLLIAM
jgi:hypothetical protein